MSSAWLQKRRPSLPPTRGLPTIIAPAARSFPRKHGCNNLVTDVSLRQAVRALPGNPAGRIYLKTEHVAAGRGQSFASCRKLPPMLPSLYLQVTFSEPKLSPVVRQFWGRAAVGVLNENSGRFYFCLLTYRSAIFRRRRGADKLRATSSALVHQNRGGTISGKSQQH